MVTDNNLTKYQTCLGTLLSLSSPWWCWFFSPHAILFLQSNPGICFSNITFTPCFSLENIGANLSNLSTLSHIALTDIVSLSFFSGPSWRPHRLQSLWWSSHNLLFQLSPLQCLLYLSLAYNLRFWWSTFRASHPRLPLLSNSFRLSAWLVREVPVK